MHMYLTNYICSYVCMIHYITVQYSTVRIQYNKQYLRTEKVCNPCRKRYGAVPSTIVKICELFPSYMHDTIESEHIRAFEVVTWTNHLQCLSASHHMPTENIDQVVLSSFLRHVIRVRERCLVGLLETLGSIQSNVSLTRHSAQFVMAKKSYVYVETSITLYPHNTSAYRSSLR